MGCVDVVMMFDQQAAMIFGWPGHAKVVRCDDDVWPTREAGVVPKGLMVSKLSWGSEWLNETLLPVLWQSSGQNRRMSNDVALRPQSRWVWGAPSTGWTCWTSRESGPARGKCRVEGQEGTLVACMAGTGSTTEDDWVWEACELETWSPDDGGSQVFTVFINKQIPAQLTQNRIWRIWTSHQLL